MIYLILWGIPIPHLAHCLMSHISLLLGCQMINIEIQITIHRDHIVGWLTTPHRPLACLATQSHRWNVHSLCAVFLQPAASQCCCCCLPETFPSNSRELGALIPGCQLVLKIERSSDTRLSKCHTCVTENFPGSDFPQELRRHRRSWRPSSGWWSALAPVEMLTVPAPYISTRHQPASVTLAAWKPPPKQQTTSKPPEVPQGNIKDSTHYSYIW